MQIETDTTSEIDFDTTTEIDNDSTEIEIDNTSEMHSILFKETTSSTRQEMDERKTFSQENSFEEEVSPIFEGTQEISTESNKPISYSKEDVTFLSLNILRNALKDAAVYAIIFWKPSLMILVIFVLSLLLFIYQQKNVQLKAEIVKKNLSNSYNQPCSCGQGTNAYTPIYFPRMCSGPSLEWGNQSNIAFIDYATSSKSKSSDNTRNPTFHLYESIDDILAETSSKKSSKVSNDSSRSSSIHCMFKR